MRAPVLQLARFVVPYDPIHTPKRIQQRLGAGFSLGMRCLPRDNERRSRICAVLYRGCVVTVSERLLSHSRQSPALPHRLDGHTAVAGESLVGR